MSEASAWSRRAFLTAVLAAPLATSGCALVFHGPTEKAERSGRIIWGYVLLDLVVAPFLIVGIGPLVGLVVPIGLIIDIATGSLYVRGPRKNRRGRPSDDDELYDDEPPDDLYDDSVPDDDGRRLTTVVEAPICAVARTAIRGRRDPLAAARAFARHAERCDHCQLAVIRRHGTPLALRVPSVDHVPRVELYGGEPVTRAWVAQLDDSGPTAPA